MKSFFISNSFLIFVLLVNFMPYLGSIDVLATQWFYIATINALFLIFSKNIFIPKNILFIIFSFFIFQAFISLSYSNNLNVSLVDFFRFFSVFLLIFILSNRITTQTFNFYNISLLVSLTLVIEVFYSLDFLFSFINLNGVGNLYRFNENYQEINFIGFAGNKNITAASIAVKFPFLFYLFFKSKNFIKYLIIIFSFFLFTSIFLLKARSVFLSLGIVLIISIVYFFYKRKFIFGVFLLPIICSFLFSSFLIGDDSSNSITGDIRSIQFSKESSNDRLLLWDNALSYISDNPFIGAGIGNWKIESIPYWKTHLSSYIVPYHAHNDLLEITTELGILGGLTFLSVFLISFYLLIRSFFNSYSDFSSSLAIFIVFTSLLIYFVDVNLNFPNERPRMQVMFAILIFIVMSLTTNKSLEK